MAQYKVTDSELSGIASAIRLKGGTSDPLVFPSGFVSAISAIEAHGTYISKIITSNGEYDPSSDNVDAFSHVTVSVPTGSSPVIVSKSISQNGIYNPADDNADAYSGVVVNVSGGGGSNDNFLIATGNKSGIVYDDACTEIISYAFYYNPNITGINAQNAKKIGSSCFQGADMLMSAIFPECTQIGDNAFIRCAKLSNISFPKCATIMGTAFMSCSSLKTVSFPSCLEVSNQAFRFCTQLLTVSLPICISIRTSAFMGCNALENVYLQECAIIQSAAFMNCYKVSNISLPKCQQIGSQAFYGCSSLQKVYLLYSTIAVLSNSNAFFQTMISISQSGIFGSIFVPASLVDAYKSASNWSVYSDRITAYVEE